MQWYQTPEGQQKGRLSHSYLNLKGAAFEKVEHYIKNSMVVLSEPETPCNRRCPDAYEQILRLYPEYLSARTDEFF